MNEKQKQEILDKIASIKAEISIRGVGQDLDELTELVKSIKPAKEKPEPAEK